MSIAQARKQRAKQAVLLALRTSLRYLEHPDVQAINFALSAKVAAKRVRTALRLVERVSA